MDEIFRVALCLGMSGMFPANYKIKKIIIRVVGFF